MSIRALVGLSVIIKMAESYTISFFRQFALSFELSGSEVGIYKLKDFKKERKHAKK